MWEPPPPPPPSARSPDHGRYYHDEFQLCKSAFRLGKATGLRGHLLVTKQVSCCVWMRFAPPLISDIRFVFFSAIDSDSEDDDPRFYLASDSSGRTQQSAPVPGHNLSLLSLTVMIGKGRLQARTDKKVTIGG